MPKPPHWVPYLGPPLAGLAAYLGSMVVEGFWPLALLAIVFGFLPIVVYRYWRKAYLRRD